MPVTAEQVETLRGQMDPQQFEIVTMILSEAQIREVQAALGIGQPKVYRAVRAAEAILGFRIRRVHGSKRGHGRPTGTPGQSRRQYRPVILAAGGKPPGDRCPRCWLLEPHSCMALPALGEWMGNHEDSLRERLYGGRR